GTGHDVYSKPDLDRIKTTIMETIQSINIFFSRYGGHRDLHSFPTRRSSDLYCCRHCLLCSSRQHSNGLSHHGRRDRKSGSAGMPRPISYAVFCLKKKKTTSASASSKRTPSHR